MGKIQGFNDTIAWYDANAEQYSQNLEPFASIALIDGFVETVGVGKKVLDAGCAAGRDSRLLKDRGLEVIGLDLSSSLLELARKNHPDIQFIQGDFRDLSLENDFFDGVWAHASLLHFETLEEVTQALKEFNRVLKKDGILHVFVKQQQGKEKTAVVSDKLSGHDRFFQWFTRDEMRELLEKTGFSIIKLEENYADPAGRDEVKWVYGLAKKIAS